MALCRTIIRSVGFGSVNWTHEPNRAAGVLRRANSILLSDTHSDFFVTAIYGLLNPITGEFTFCNGGHTRPILIKADGTTEFVGSYGVALGIVEGVPLIQQRVSLLPGDTLILYTDGITEAANDDEELFGTERLRELLAQQPIVSAENTLARIQNAVTAFTNNNAQSDDETLVIIRRLP